DATEHYCAVKLAVLRAARNETRSGGLRQNLRNLERSGNRDALIGDALRVEGGNSSTDELIGNVGGEAAFDDEHTRAQLRSRGATYAARWRISFDDHAHSIPR